MATGHERNAEEFSMKCGMIWLLTATLCVTGVAARADDLAQAGREIVAKWEKAVVTVEVVIRTRGAGDEKGDEEKSEAIGVVIDPAGLVVANLTNIDPGTMYNEMTESLGDEGEKLKTTSEIIGARFLLPDGGEVRAQVVLRDSERDLIFLRALQKPATPLTALSLHGAGEAGLLDTVFLLSRQGTDAHRAITVTLARVQTVITKPRPCSMVSDLHDLGSPVFTADGRLVGLTVLRRSGKAGARLDVRNGGVMPVVLPVKEIAAAAAQVPATE
jgi:S1-C subfamily serine protease